MTVYRTRFAPSPTGQMHLGHARTHLVAWLRARDAGGRVLMRIEDLDRPRVVEGAAEGLLRDHEWLGLDWDEGPLRQSTRSARYEEALDVLRAAGRAYPCTCSRKDIAQAASAPHDREPVYPGTCREGPTQPWRPRAWRFRVEDADRRGFEDGVLGAVPPPAPDAMGDFVLRRADGLFAYQLAVTVDDADEGVTEVVRGADLVASTPRQLALYRALGLRAPAFAHVALAVDGQGRRLAKRDGAQSIASLRAAGVSPERILGALACSLGLTASAAPVSLAELRGRLDLSRLPPGPARLALAG